MTSLLLLIIGLVILYYGAEFLIKGAVSAATLFGVTPLAIGLTVVAFGTSAPELTVSISAVISGSGDISAANVIGSNIFNIAVILGMTALIYPVRITWQLIRVDLPIMIAVTLLAAVCLRNSELSRWEGLLLVAGIITYTGWTLKQSSKNSKDQQLAKEQSPTVKTHTLPLSIAFVIGGLLMLVAGAKCFVNGATSLARMWNISEAIIGLTIVSVGTSLPELATSMVAAFRKQSDIAVGNIVGSNIFNILGILGSTALIHPYSASGIKHTDLLMMILIAVLSLPLMWTKFTLNRIEGAVLLAIYSFYMYFLWLHH